MHFINRFQYNNNILINKLYNLIFIALINFYVAKNINKNNMMYIIYIKICYFII